MQTTVDELTIKGKTARIAARQLAKVRRRRQDEGAAEHRRPSRVQPVTTILDANQLDLENGRAKGLEPYYLDRMMLDPDRLAAIADGRPKRGRSPRSQSVRPSK